MEELIKQAEQGDAEAQFKLGLAYYNGDGINRNYRKAYHWFLKSAEQGNSEAQYWVGYMLRKGKKIGTDYKKAMEWFRKSALQDNPSALLHIGGMYHNGEGCKRDVKVAFEYIKKAADLGLPKAYMYMGVWHRLYGDSIAALSWFEKAADEDEKFLPEIADQLSSYMPETAFKWRLRAAKTGNMCSQYQAGKMYEYGKGVIMDTEQARYWYGLAAEQGHFEAKKALRMMDLYPLQEMENELMKPIPSNLHIEATNLIAYIDQEIESFLGNHSDNWILPETFTMEIGNRQPTIYLNELLEEEENVSWADVKNYIMLTELMYWSDSNLMNHACLNEAYRILVEYNLEDAPYWVVKDYFRYYRRRGMCYLEGREYGKAAKAFEESMKHLYEYLWTESDEEDWGSTYFEIWKIAIECWWKAENYEQVKSAFQEIGEMVEEGFSKEGDYNFYQNWYHEQYKLVEYAYKEILPALDKANQSLPSMYHQYSLYLKQTRRFTLAEKVEHEMTMTQ